MNIGLVSLGCPKNLVDSERLLGSLRALGHQIVPSYEQAETVVVNTCGFTDPATQESLEAIEEALETGRRVIVMGCLSVRADQELRQRYPDLFAICGEGDVAGVLHSLGHRTVIPDPELVRLTPRHYAYLKISEGCHHRCTFCIIPTMRGDHRPRPLEDLVQQADLLYQNGARELNLIGQDTTAYDFGGLTLSDLIGKLARPGLWLRLLYAYPVGYWRQEEQLWALMNSGALLPYLDMPLQHASTPVLKRMQRPGNAQRYLEILERLRRNVPNVTVRTTFIVGFPGETEADFQELLDFIAAARFDRLGAFQYSPVQGARANTLDHHVPPEVAQERYDRLMALQQQISLEINQALIGQELAVLVEGPSPLGDSSSERRAEGLIGRTIRDAPEIDGVILLHGQAKPGEVVRAQVTAAGPYDLEGTLVQPGGAKTPQASSRARRAQQ